jgi:hypothetical protein
LPSGFRMLRPLPLRIARNFTTDRARDDGGRRPGQNRSPELLGYYSRLSACDGSPPRTVTRLCAVTARVAEDFGAALPRSLARFQTCPSRPQEEAPPSIRTEGHAVRQPDLQRSRSGRLRVRQEIPHVPSWTHRLPGQVHGCRPVGFVEVADFGCGRGGSDRPDARHGHALAPEPTHQRFRCIAPRVHGLMGEDPEGRGCRRHDGHPVRHPHPVLNKACRLQRGFTNRFRNRREV